MPLIDYEATIMNTLDNINAKPGLYIGSSSAEALFHFLHGFNHAFHLIGLTRDRNMIQNVVKRNGIDYDANHWIFVLEKQGKSLDDIIQITIQIEKQIWKEVFREIKRIDIDK